MQLATLLTKAKRGPLKDLVQATDPTKQPELIHAANQAMLELYTRLPVKLKVLTLAVADGVFEYPLRVEYAQTNGDPSPKYIQDSVGKPFLGDVISIQQINDEDGNRIPLNTEGDSKSWFANADILTMDYPVTGDVYFVEFRARPEEIDPDTVDLDVNLYVPPAMENALLARMEYEVYCGMNMEASSLKAQAALQKYEMAVALLDEKNALNQSVTDARNVRFCRDGWA